MTALRLARERLERHPLLIVVVPTALALGAVALLADLAGGERLDRAAQNLHPAWLVLCFGGQLLAYAGYVLVVRDTARVDNGPTLTFGESLRTVVAGFGVFAATRTSGGFAVDYWALRNAGENRDVPLSLTLPWLAVIPGALVAVWLSSPKRAPRYSDPGDGGRLRQWFAHAVAGLSILRMMFVAPPREHGLGLLGAAAYWAGDIACLWGALQVFGNPRLSVPALIVGYATGYVLTRRSLPAGGAGIVEIAMTFALHWVGFPFVRALLGVVVYRLFNLWLPMLPALAVLPQVTEMRAEFEQAEPSVPTRRT